MAQKKVWAVAGANDRPEKFGCMIYKKLKSKGYKVFAVNPNYKTVDGDICYPDISSLPEVPEVIDMVVNPRQGRTVIEEAIRLGVKNIWLQPGTYDDDLIAFIEQNGLTYVKACVLVDIQ